MLYQLSILKSNIHSMKKAQKWHKKGGIFAARLPVALYYYGLATVI
jgi:hypothetical protein